MTAQLYGSFYSPGTRGEVLLHSHLDPCLLYYTTLPHLGGSIWRTHSSLQREPRSEQRLGGASTPTRSYLSLMCWEHLVVCPGKIIAYKTTAGDQENCGSSRSFASLCPGLYQARCHLRSAVAPVIRNVFLQHVVLRAAKPRVNVFGRLCIGNYSTYNCFFF